MGLHIPHFTAPSPVHGTGLFSRVSLLPGDLLWSFDPLIDHRALLRQFPPRVRLRLLHFGYVNAEYPDWVVVCGDCSRYWNFPHPGTHFNAHPSQKRQHGEALIVASRPIAAGEELLIDPSSDADYFRKMGLQRHSLLPLMSCKQSG
jgi:hypothetical protein